MLKRLLITIASLAVVVAGVLLFLQKSQTASAKKNDSVLVVTTNSILMDMVENVGGKYVTIHSIVPRGTDPHEYEPRPQDVSAVVESDLIFHNGLNLETGGNGWFTKLVESAHKEEDGLVFSTSEGVTAKHLTGVGKENEEDPHAWLDLQNGICYVKNITKALVEKDTKHKAYFEENSAKYIAQLEKLDKEAKQKFKNIPEEKKLLVTSEGAFKYFGSAYDLQAAYIWEINSESQGTPEQMEQVLSKIRDSNVQNLFVESSVSPKAMEMVAKETGLSIYSTIFTDSLAKKGNDGDTYYGMMKWNLDKIHEGLSK
ncbi:MAG: metal ABC transporter substrate-binding protein [Lactobacillales bacterium]|jgi:iron/zinc/copper transport system substrate-binding protein|nr:metal ABC transporter substrate-binding protein [Lactobacillales bacterium]